MAYDVAPEWCEQRRLPIGRWRARSVTIWGVEFQSGISYLEKLKRRRPAIRN
ncbi:MAG: hypothetical protein ACKPEY_03990 [Planctomycetota bacterium]